MYKLVYKKSAAKELDKIPGNIALKILETMECVANAPDTHSFDIKKMQWLQNFYRLRIGNYRVIYEIKEEIITIVVVKIGGRGDVYK